MTKFLEIFRNFLAKIAPLNSQSYMVHIKTN